MQKGFGVIYILLGILILGLVAGSAYYFGKSSSIPQPLSLPPTSTLPIKVDKNAPTDQTANWKTFTDKNLGIEFKYPPNAYFYNKTIDRSYNDPNDNLFNPTLPKIMREPLRSIEVSLPLPTDPEKNDFGKNVSITVTIDLYLEDATSKPLTLQQIIKKEFSSKVDRDKLITTTIDNNPAYKYISGDGKTIPMITIYTSNLNHNYEIKEEGSAHAVPQGVATYPIPTQQIKIFENFLSTFKFTN